MTSIYEARQMDGLTAEQQASKAIAHLIGKLKTDDRLFNLIGLGSQSFDLLTEAYASLTATDLATLRKSISA
ncbi:MAG: hypothetical protein V4451_16195 [Pseudomonadota bacterium]